MLSSTTATSNLMMGKGILTKFMKTDRRCYVKQWKCAIKIRVHKFITTNDNFAIMVFFIFRDFDSHGASSPQACPFLNVSYLSLSLSLKIVYFRHLSTLF